MAGGFGWKNVEKGDKLDPSYNASIFISSTPFLVAQINTPNDLQHLFYGIGLDL